MKSVIEDAVSRQRAGAMLDESRRQRRLGIRVPVRDEDGHEELITLEDLADRLEDVRLGR